jgi:hypothetical protein
MRNSIWLLITAAVVLLVAYGAYAAHRNSSLSANFKSVQPGASRKQVLSMMGKPTFERNGCRDAATWLGQPLVGKTCATELQYDARFIPKFWTIGFDEKGFAIAKYEYVSP